MAKAITSTPRRPGSSTQTGEEVWLRRVAGAAILYLQLQGALGLAWDIQWHTSVGRDTFLTPPHILLYTSVALSGLVCLGMVLLETLRYRKGKGVHDGNSMRVLGFFHAPLGFVVVGFGYLTVALAAPLDNYWHELYGIDVALWAPFHMMGLIGAFIGGLGSVYLWSAFLVEARQRGGDLSWRRPEIWAVLLGLMFLLGHVLTMTRPALRLSPVLDLGLLHIMTYPVLLAIGIPWILVAANRVTSRLGAASIVVLLLIGRDFLFQLFVPWAVHTGAAAEGLPFRDPSLAPSFSLTPLLFDLGLLVLAVVVDLLVWLSPLRGSRKRSFPATLGIVAGAGLYLVAVSFTYYWAPTVTLPPGVHAGTPADWTAALLALPIALSSGALSSVLGDGVAQVWQRNPR